MRGGQIIARSRWSRWVLPIALALRVLDAAPARAEDRVAELSKMLSSSSNEKGRLAAVAALARLGDRRAMKPLVAALSDPSAQVRAVAAAALGKLGHKAALVALKGAAIDDLDPTVRARAKEAAIAVARTNQLPAPWPEEVAAPRTRKPGRAGFGNQPRALEAQPDLYVMVNSSTDDSPGKTDKPTRKQHGEILRQTLLAACKGNALITTVAADAQRLGLTERHIDVSVIKLEVATTGHLVEVEAQLRLAISDAHGKMLSFLSGGAKVQVPKHKFNAQYLPNLRREALENAMRGMFDKLVAHLRTIAQS